MSPDVCPHCGAEIPPNACACSECGSDEHTGWSERAHYDNLGLPDDEFDYKEFTRHEFGGKRRIPEGIHWFWWIVAVLVLAAFGLMLLR